MLSVCTWVQGQSPGPAQCTRDHTPEEENDSPSLLNQQLAIVPQIEMVHYEPLINLMATEIYVPDTTCHIAFKLVLLI